MADPVDLGNEEAEQFLNRSLANMKRVKLPDVTGCCFNCGDILVEDVRWCDENCRDDWLLRNPNFK